MVFADWTFSGNGSGALDASVKHSGSSSYKTSTTGSTGLHVTKLTHDTFSEPQLTVIFWARLDSSTHSNPWIKIGHTSYGTMGCQKIGDNVFYKYRITFWYDLAANIKWGRVERYIDSAWVQYGTDTNFGSGSPAAASISLELHKGNSSSVMVGTCWFDDVDIYA